MNAITVSSKGQLVLPKPVRDALRIRPGARLGVHIEGTRVILETAGPSLGWQPLNPFGTRLSNRDLCRPVDLTRVNEPRSG